MINRAELKSHAKDQLRGKWGLAVGGFFLEHLLTQVIAQVIIIVSDDIFTTNINRIFSYNNYYFCNECWNV